MAKTKISKLAKDLNVALPTVFEFLRSKEISIEESPNTRVEDSIAELINNEFNDDRILKNRSEQATEDRLKNRGKNNNTQKNEPTELIKTASENMQKPKIVGKIDLDKNGNPVKAEQPAAKPAVVEQAKPAEAKVEQPAVAQPKEPAHNNKKVTTVIIKISPKSKANNATTTKVKAARKSKSLTPSNRLPSPPNPLLRLKNPPSSKQRLLKVRL